MFTGTTWWLAAVVAIVAVALGVVTACSQAQAVPLVGQPAPDFTLPSQDGSLVSLKDFRGKWVVLYFYPKDGTSGCTLEAHNFQRDLPKYDAAKAVIIGVSLDSTGSHKEFCAKQGLTFKLASDTDKQAVRDYGSLRSIAGFKIAARNTFLVDPDGKIAKVWLGVNPGHHSEEVLGALAELEKSR